MPRNPERDRQQREERRQQIIDAAKQVFTKRGVAATKMSDVAKEAGLSHGNVYNYFASKEELLSVLVLQAQAGYTELLLEMNRQPGHAIDKLRFLVERYLFVTGAGTTYWVVLQAQAADVLSPSIKGAITSNMMANRQLIIQVIEEGQRDGIIAAGDSIELATLFITAFHHLGLWELRGFGKPALSVVEPLLKLLRP